MRTLLIGSVLFLLAGCVSDRDAIRDALDRAETLLTQIETELENARELLEQNESDGTPSEPTPETERETAKLLPLPLLEWHGGVWSLPGQFVEDVRHMPVYRSNGGTLFVGVDQGTDTTSGTEHLGKLPAAGKRGDIALRHGRLNDGAGRDKVLRYLNQAAFPAQARRMTSPLVRIVGPASESDIDFVTAAVQIVNAALPEGAKLRLGQHLPFPGSNGVPLIEEAQADNTIAVQFVTRQWFFGGASAGAVATIYPVGPRYSYVQFNRQSHSYGVAPEMVTLLAHELIHSVGVHNHISTDLATIMEGTNAIHHGEQNGHRKPLSFLYPVDREALRALNGPLANSDSLTDLGPWASTSMHLAGNGPHANFGVALRNGYAEPWAHGYTPDADLAENTELRGAAVWDGALVGLTPQAEAVTGEAAIRVSLGTLAGVASFTELEHWAPRLRPGTAGTGTTWGDGDLDYSIAVAGNTFRETGGDDGRLTGIFTGRSHEGAAGTLERSDLTAAFGASRE